MKTTTTAPDYRGYRFPPEIISRAVWLYFRFSLSFRSGRRASGTARDRRDLRNRAPVVRCTFGQTDANELHRRRPQCGGQVAPGRGLSHDPWRETFSVVTITQICGDLRDDYLTDCAKACS
jgi:hypothetical protein